jgi:DNA-binding response OmpR family regulator
MKKKIFLLEDDITLNETITEYFEDLEYEVISAYDGYEAQDKLYEQNFDILLLDVNVPDINGFELLKEAREQNIDTPAIFITSLNAMVDVEEGYESGCDDYIRKPFSLKELQLRVETIIKRGFFHQKDDSVQIDKQISYNASNDTLKINEDTIQLKNKDAKLLKIFLQHKDEILSHETIYSKLWNYDEESSETALRTYIKNLRKYLGKEKIVSIKKLGYKFTTK